MPKMGLYDPFEYLKHKLWSKEKLGVKLSIWPLTTKIKNHPDFLVRRWHPTHCYKDLGKGYNFNLDFISIRGLHTKLWASKVVRVPILGILGLPLGSPGTKWHFGVGPMARHREYYKVWLPPRPNYDESYESMLACGSFVHQRCCNYALTNLLFGLCRFVQGIEFFINLLSPHPGASTHPSTPNVLRARERQLFFFPLFLVLDSQLNPSRSLGVRHLAP
jgi:hypothetical protein